MSETETRFLTIDEVARLLRQSRPTIYRKVALGQIPALRLGGLRGPLRVDADALADHLRPVGPRP